jgi:hypothetical protein
MIRNVAIPAKKFGYANLIRKADLVASKNGTQTYLATTSSFDNEIIVLQVASLTNFSDARRLHYTSSYARSMNRDRTIDAEPVKPCSLQLVPTRTAEAFWHDVPWGVVWRCYHFIGDRPGSCGVHAPDVPGQCFLMLSRLHEKHCGLPSSFRHMFLEDVAKTSRHQDALRHAISMNPKGRVAKCHEEILDASAYKHCFSVFSARSQADSLPGQASQLAPEEVLPGSQRSDFGFCPVDLDAVAPGLSRYGQLGENIVVSDNRKSMGRRPARARETSKSKDNPTLAVLLREFYDILTLGEFIYLVQRGRHLAHSLGMLFLSDYILGDIEYPSDFPEHNLYRAREMFKLSLRMEICSDSIMQGKRDIQLA